MLTKAIRLSRKQDLLLVLRKGRKLELLPLRLYLQVNNRSVSRFGFLLKDKALEKAVRRNRWKRLMREAIRRNAKRILPGLDLVFMLAERPLQPLEATVWEQQILTLLKKAGVLKKHV